MTVTSITLPQIVTDMTPGTYVRLRREAARLTVDQVAARFFGHPAARTAVKIELAAIEEDCAIAGDGDLARLAAILPLAPSVYRDLAADLPVRLCNACGASWRDACLRRASGCRRCAWEPRA